MRPPWRISIRLLGLLWLIEWPSAALAADRQFAAK